MQHDHLIILRVSRGIGGCAKRPFFCYTPKKLKGRESHFWLKLGRAFIDLKPFSCQKWLSKFEIQISRQAQGNWSLQLLPPSQARKLSRNLAKSCNWRDKLPQSNTNVSFWSFRSIWSGIILPNLVPDWHFGTFWHTFEKSTFGIWGGVFFEVGAPLVITG